MAKKIFFSFILSLMTGYTLFAQADLTDANVMGHVIDKTTNEHIAYVTIRLVGTSYGTMTDATGHYFLKNIPDGD